MSRLELSDQPSHLPTTAKSITSTVRAGALVLLGLSAQCSPPASEGVDPRITIGMEHDTSPDGAKISEIEKLPIAPGLVFTVQVQPDGIAQVLGVTPFTKDKRYFPVSVDFPTHRIQVHVGNETFTQEFSAVEVSITEYVDSSGQMHGGMDRKQKMAPFEVIVPLPEKSTVKDRMISLDDGSKNEFTIEIHALDASR